MEGHEDRWEEGVSEEETDRNQTGGGPPPKDLKPGILRTIDLMKDHASFKGVDGGLDMFTDDDAADPYVEVSRVSDMEDPELEERENISFSSSSCPGTSSRTVNTTATRIDTSPSHHQQEHEASVDPNTDSNPFAPDNAGKRKHSLTVSDRQAKVLKGEEEIQQLKRDNLRLMKQKLQIEVEVANLQKKKLQMEISLLRRENPTLTYDLEDQVILDPATAFSFEDLLNN